MSSLARTIWRSRLLLVGLVIAVVGAVVLAEARTTSFGWTAYAPMHGTFPRTNNLVLHQPQAVIGLVLLVAGVGLATGAVGYRIGRRRDGDESGSSTS